MENVLTVEVAKELRGKRIKTFYQGYAGQNGKDDFVVGEIISEWDLASRDQFKGFENRQEHWKTFFSEEKINTSKKRLELLKENGERTFFYCEETPVFDSENKVCGWSYGAFNCSDDDRWVTYQII